MSWTPAWLYAALIGAVLATYGRIVTHDFVAWDDELHVSENPHLDPVSWQGLVRLWRAPYFQHYVPLSYTVYTAEAWLAQTPRDELGKLHFNPAVFHAGSLLMHLACVLAAFWLLRSILGHPAAACLGALVFALHPLQVESVAWVSEQRGLLAGLFALLCMLAWLKFGAGVPRDRVGQAYAFQAAAIEGATGGIGYYLLATGAFLCALLSKPSGVSVPLLAFALDRCLLRRAWRVSLFALLPWVLLAAGIVVVTQREQPAEMLSFLPPVWARPLIAGDALQFYLTKMVWPFELTIQYPRAPVQVLAGPWVYFAWLVPCALLLACFRFRRQGPWGLCTAWFLAVLAPVLGLAPFAYQHFSTVADRYAYLALLAPALAVAWWIAQHPSRPRYRAVAALAAVLGVLSFQQSGHWRDTQALLGHTLRVNPRSDVAHGNLSGELLRSGRYADALHHVEEALRINPRTGTEKLYLNRGLALLSLGRVDEAIAAYQQTLARFPQSNPAHLNLSAAYFQRQDWENTIQHARAALLVEPESVAARFNLALALDRQGRDEESTSELRRLLEYWPQQFEAHMKLASKLRAQGRIPESLEHFSAGVASRPEDRAARFDYALALMEARQDAQALQQFRRLIGQPASDWPLIAAHTAWLLATRLPQEPKQEALDLADAACRRTGFQDPIPLRALAAAQAAMGDLSAAEKTVRQARQITQGADRSSLAAALDGDLERYRAGLPTQPGALSP